jgi:hypothetical protein
MLRKDTIRFKVLHVAAFYAIVMQSFFPIGSLFAAPVKTPVMFSKDNILVQYLPAPVTQHAPKAIREDASATTENKLSCNTVEKKIALAVPFGGPGQSETSGFSLNSTDGMVDPFTGDFSYSIPLADVEGYPIVISYNSNITMNSEASWVGLGWDLNVGAVSREMRGLPDEFNGEQTIIRKFNQNPDDGSGNKFGGYVALKATLFGGNEGDKYSGGIKAQLTALKGKYTTNYLGEGKTFDFGLQASPSAAISNSGLFVAPSFGLGYSSDSKRGVGTYKSYGLSAGLSPGDSWKVTAPLNYGFTKSFHSRSGMLDRSHTFGVELGYGNLSGGSAGYGATSTIPYGTLTSVPSVKFNSSGSATRNSIDGFLGRSNGIVTASVGIKYEWYDNNEVIALNSNSEIVQPAIGYFHSGKWSHYVQNISNYGSKIPLMDFNRTNDMEYSEEMKHLAFSVQTYDIFRANASGLGATFRARRSDVGTYKDQDLLTSTGQSGVNTTVGAVLKPSIVSPAIIKGSIEVSDNGGNAIVQSGNLKQTDGTNVLDFNQEAEGASFDSRVYFKGVGETTPENLSDFNTLGGSTPTRIELATSGNDGIALTGVVKGDGFSDYTVNKTAINALETPVRAMRYQPFTASEYANAYPYFYSVSGPGNSMLAPPLSRLQSLSASAPYYRNHLSAVEIVNTDGIKYVFGIPAYELNSSQVSFCMTGALDTDADGDGVAFFSSGDNTTGNTKGVSNYYDKTTVPAYPHSFLLTEMRSSDYVDRTTNGPSLDDVGNYYKFNYTRVYDANAPYKWRFPVEGNSAYFDKGLLGTTTDDMGNYSYGEKEIWYTHSIESKNLIAEFQLTPREDACGVLGENGGINTNMKLSKLSKIVIYNRSERLGSNGSNALPLQTVEFEYSYELCKDNPANSNQGSGNEGGKLTLKKIRSYAGTSFEMGLYAYEFYYDGDQNKDFSYRTDSWGNWKESNSYKPNAVYPYSVQNNSNSSLDNLAQNWKLMRIVSPTRGEISIDYEADCYSTVQDKRAMQMQDIVGFTNMMDLYNIQSGSYWNINTSSNIYLDFNNFYSSSSHPNWSVMDNYMEQFGPLDRTNVPNNVVVFKLSKQINAGLTYQQASDELKKLAFTDGNKVIEELYLKLHVLVKSTVNELIPAFGKISADFNGIKSIGVMPKTASDANYEYGYVVLDPALVDDEGKNDGHVFNSLQKAAIQFIRRNLPDVVYGAIAGADGDIILDKAVALKKDDIDLLMNRKLWAKSIYTDFSSIRLYVASGKKYGGLGRVHTITYKDNWIDISGENIPGTYVWQYDYNEEGTATSGNAAFEPHSIIDESALYMWDTYVNFREKYPDETKFTPTPVAAILYPAPIIGYEWIKTSMPLTANNGYSISEFHTSRTHPVIVPPSSIDKSAHIKKPEKEIGSLLSGKTMEKFGFSQGFVIETNDFHGKPKQSIVYAIAEQQVQGQGSIQTPVINARTIYEYADLNQKHPTLGRNSETMTNEYLAQEADIHADSRYVVNNYELYELGVNLSLTWTLPSPIPFPFITPVIHRTSRRQDFYSTALVKHINRSAIVTSIKTETLGSINTQRNEVYDYYTGNTIVSSLNDEYNDRLYSMNAPSHWYYKELRELYSSQDAIVTVNIAADGTISNADELLTPGDNVEILSIAGTQLAWIAKHNASNNGDLFLMGPDGQVSTYVTAAGAYQLKIIKSNRDNRLNESMMGIVTKKNPINGTTCSFPTTEIISADVLTYKDRNSLKCGTPDPNQNENPNKNNNEVTLNSIINPYLYGVRGDLVLDGAFAWQSERNQTPHPYKTRFDGTFQAYTPFYSLVSGKWTKMVLPTEPPVSTTGWRKMGEATVYNEYGTPIESKDQLDIYSSVIYGFNRTFALVPVGQAVNARQQEIGFDGFEDYAYYGTQSALIINNVPHFDFKSADDASAQVSTDQTTRHSGLYSLKITGNSNASVIRKVTVSTCEASSVIDPRCNCFKVNDCACIKPFEPTPGDYIISVWVRNTNPLQSAPGTVTTIVAGSGMATDTRNFTASGPVIDGWQRLEGKFTIPVTGADTVTIRLNHVSGSEAYFDDVRVHPFLAGMTTTVYDPKTLLPMATHDGYNFTTFYNYDENLNLVRVRVETVEGIKTVSESEMGSYKR